MRSDAEVQVAARRIFEGVTPERSEELGRLWEKYEPSFNLLTDASPDGLFVLEAGVYRYVRFNQRALRAFWLASYAAWDGWGAVATQSVDHRVDFRRFDAILRSFGAVLAADDPEAVPLPEGVPAPGDYPSTEVSAEGRAAAELATIATGWALLHEVRHIQHQQEGTGAGEGAARQIWHREELSCDKFATRFVLDKVDDHARQTSEPAERVRRKREIGVYFALFAMTLVGGGHWDETDSHPAMDTRIRAVIAEMGEQRSREADAIGHAAFAALWSVYPDAPGPFKR